jgi:hypothetical protein
MSDSHAKTKSRRKSDRRCSFCGRGERDVERLIVGPFVYICDLCVGLCVEMLETPAEPPKVAEHIAFSGGSRD